MLRFSIRRRLRSKRLPTGNFTKSGRRMRLPSFGRRLSADAFTDLVIREVTGRAPDLELRIIERLTLRVVAAETEQRTHLDRAFEQYLETPRELGEIVGRWTSVIVGWTIQQDKLDLAAVVPMIKARRWIGGRISRLNWMELDGIGWNWRYKWMARPILQV